MLLLAWLATIIIIGFIIVTLATTTTQVTNIPHAIINEITIEATRAIISEITIEATRAIIATTATTTLETTTIEITMDIHEAG